MRKQRLLTGIAGILMAFLFTGCNTSSVEEWVDEVVEDINGQIPDNTLLPVESVSEEKYVYGQLTEEEQRKQREAGFRKIAMAMEAMAQRKER